MDKRIKTLKSPVKCFFVIFISGYSHVQPKNSLRLLASSAPPFGLCQPDGPRCNRCQLPKVFGKCGCMGFSMMTSIAAKAASEVVSPPSETDTPNGAADTKRHPWDKYVLSSVVSRLTAWRPPVWIIRAFCMGCRMNVLSRLTLKVSRDHGWRGVCCYEHYP